MAKRRDEPDEGAQQEEREAEERDLARGPLVLHAEVALGHGRGVVAEARHDRPAHDVAPAVPGRQGERGHLRGQAGHEPGEPAHLRERGEGHHDRERHQDRRLQEVGDDDRPEPADHAVDEDHRARARDRPGERPAAGRGHEEPQAVEHAGPGEELEEDRGPGEGLAGPLVVAVHQVLHDGADPRAPPALRRRGSSRAGTCRRCRRRAGSPRGRAGRRGRRRR